MGEGWLEGLALLGKADCGGPPKPLVRGSAAAVRGESEGGDGDMSDGPHPHSELMLLRVLAGRETLAPPVVLMPLMTPLVSPQLLLMRPP